MSWISAAFDLTLLGTAYQNLANASQPLREPYHMSGGSATSGRRDNTTLIAMHPSAPTFELRRGGLRRSYDTDPADRQ